MIRLALLAAGILAVTAARADDKPAPVGPCAHGPARMMMSGVDPVEQSCALAMAGQTIAEQAQQIVGLRAQLAVAKNDLEAAKSEADAARKAPSHPALSSDAPK